MNISASSDMAQTDAPTTGSFRRKKDRQARKYGFACANCRKRKARCDGNLPNCDRCVAHGETCHFNTVPSVAYSMALQNKVTACESLLSKLQSANDAERLQILNDYFSTGNITEIEKPSNRGEGVDASPRSDGSPVDDLADLFNETSVDEDGRICFYGTTSLFHLQPDQTKIQSREVTDTPLGFPDETTSWERTVQWQDNLSFNTPSPSVSTSFQAELDTFQSMGVSSELCNELLEVYWSWPHHLHRVLVRKFFMRDLATFGPYVTPFLLTAVLAQAARYSDRPEASKLGQYFAKRALDSLAVELNKGSSIPTIQALLIFSARECAVGRTAQGWLYSGMAFRMMRDMGIHIPPRKLSHLVGQFSPVELALRQQMFWSCYTWDKTISLCLGRAPTIRDIMPLPTTETIIDGEDAEEEMWKPKFASVSALEVEVSQKAKTNSRFIAYCELCVIIDDVLGTLYSKPHPAQHHLEGFLDSTVEKLETWAKKLPSHLYVKNSSRSISCPPLHILLLNLLYHATIILLCRPYRSSQDRARTMATAAAEMIDRLFMLHIRRFGFRVITYLASYTMFVASTINILDLKAGLDSEGASARLALGLEIFRNATSTPSNARCVEIIEELLNKNEKPRERNVPESPQPWTQPSTALPNQNTFAAAKQDLPQSFQAAPSFEYPPSTVGPPQSVERPRFLNMPGVDMSPLIHEMSGSGATPLSTGHTHATSAVETPLRWLADNVNNDHSWMIMDMDFAKDFEAYPMNVQEDRQQNGRNGSGTDS